MKMNQELYDLTCTFLNHDEGMEFFAPGFVNATDVEKDLIPWNGLQNLNRCVYFSLTFYYFFYSEMIADLTIGFNNTKTEAIIVELKDDFVELINLARKGLSNGRMGSISSAKAVLIKDIFRFAKKSPAKFNELYANDPNIKKLAAIEGTISQPLITTEREVYEYYSKAVKVVFNK